MIPEIAFSRHIGTLNWMIFYGPIHVGPTGRACAQKNLGLNQSWAMRY